MNKTVCLLALGVAIGLHSPIALAQETKPTQEMKPSPEGMIEHQTNFTPAEMNRMWQDFSQDKAWMVLMKEAKGKGFERRREDSASWGFKGVHVGPQGQRAEALFCVFDFQKKGSKERLSLLWAQRGTERYKAYLLTPAGKDLQHSDEWFVDKDLKIQRAHSWLSCFTFHLGNDCGKTCFKSLVICGFVGAGAEAAQPESGFAVFLGCVTVVCGGCASLAAIQCAFAR